MRSIERKRLHPVFLAILVALAPAIDAQTLVFEPLSGNGESDGYTGSLGEFFTANQDIQVSSIGYWDSSQDGVQGGYTISVALFYASGANSGQIVSGTEMNFSGTDGTLTGGVGTPANGDSGQFRMSDLSSPVTLSAGLNYAIVAWGFSGPNPSNLYVNGNIGTNPGPTETIDTLGGAIAFDYSSYGTAGQLPDSPNSPSTGPVYAAGDFSAAAIPEPPTVAMILGVVTLIVAMTRAWRAPSGLLRRLAEAAGMS